MSKRGKHSEEATGGSGEDRISALPVAILQVVLSFLPSDDAWETCWLSRRWRHLWKSAPALRIVQADVTYWNVRELNNIVNYILLLRDRLPLDECEISYRGRRADEDHTEIFRFTGQWIHYALSLCQARVLKIRICNVGILMTRDESLVSQFLRRVELTGVILSEHAIDFSGCPNLEDLNLCCCTTESVQKILSQSLRRLSIISCDFNLDSDYRICISAPGLVSLQLDNVRGGVPLLESMPSLVRAFIRLGVSYLDTCSHEDYRDCDECLAYDDHGDGNGCVLLQGLSGATSLELITTNRDVFIFRKDLKQCPTFSMLKTLLLNEWCVAADFGALACFLQHMPVLEKLVLQLRLDVLQTWKYGRETYESCNPTVQLVLKHLKVVEIRCHKEDELVRQIVKIMSTFGVSSDRIDVQVIQQSPYVPDFSARFSFEQKEILE